MATYTKPAISGLNTGHALYADIQAFMEFGQLDQELVGSTALTTTAALVNDVYIGDSRTFDATADAVTETISVTGDCTILLVARLTGTRASGNNSKIMFAQYNSTDQIELFYEGFSPYKYKTSSRIAGGSYVATSADGFANDTLYGDGHTVAAVFDVNGTNKICIDGTLQADTSATAAGPYSGTPTLSFMNSVGSTASVNLGAIVVFNRALSDAELQSVTSDPWALTVSSAALTADSITSGTIRAGDTVTINLSNATNATGKTLSIPQGSLTATAQDINSISFTAPDLKTFGDKTGDYNTNITITVDDAGDTATIDFQVAPDVGDEVGAITAVEGIYGDAAFTGVVATDLYYTATISGADFAVGAVPVLGTEQVFNLWIQDQTDGVWGTPFEVTIPASGTVIPVVSRGSWGALASYLRSLGTFTHTQSNELIIEWLVSLGISRTQINQMLYSYLGGLGYTGSLSDRVRAWAGGS